jgi:hypothetical protein
VPRQDLIVPAFENPWVWDKEMQKPPEIDQTYPDPEKSMQRAASLYVTHLALFTAHFFTFLLLHLSYRLSTTGRLLIQIIAF